jgi:NADH:ubiquinone oxidoreductase subunit D
VYADDLRVHRSASCTCIFVVHVGCGTEFLWIRSARAVRVHVACWLVGSRVAEVYYRHRRVEMQLLENAGDFALKTEFGNKYNLGNAALFFFLGVCFVSKIP